MKTTTTKPTMLIVPGAWHLPSAYHLLVASLERHGFPTTVVPLPSVDPPDPKTATCLEDVRSIKQQLLSLLETEGKDVVIISHSYGGVPAAGAAYALSKATRTKDGRTGGVLGLKYICAFIIPKVASKLEYLGGKHAPFVLEGQPSEHLCIASSPIETFYQDADPETANSLASSLRPHSMVAFLSPTPAPAWAEPTFEDKIAYLRCTQDRTIPVALQDVLIQRSGVKWMVRDIDAGHCPWLSKPKEVVEATMDFIEQFAA